MKNLILVSIILIGIISCKKQSVQPNINNTIVNNNPLIGVWEMATQFKGNLNVFDTLTQQYREFHKYYSNGTFNDSTTQGNIGSVPIGFKTNKTPSTNNVPIIISYGPYILTVNNDTITILTSTIMVTSNGNYLTTYLKR